MTIEQKGVSIMKMGLAIAMRREQIGLTQEELAQRIGVTKPTISRWESGDISNMRRDRIQKLADALRVSPIELLEEETDGLKGIGEESNVAAVFDDSFRMIPVFKSASAGFGAYADDCIIDYAPFRITSDSEADETIAIKVEGDSMSPKIEDGDIIQVHKQESVDSGSIAVVLLDGDEGLVKRVTYGSDWIELQSINPYYPPLRFEGAEVLRIRVVGLVKGVFHAF